MPSRHLRKIRQAMALPPHIAARKAMEILMRSLRRRAERRRDARAVTYSQNFPDALQRYVRRVPLPAAAAHREVIRRAAQLALEHRFDMLGSGAVRVQYGMNCAGAEGHCYPPPSAAPQVSEANRTESARIAALLPADYRRIDWQRDFKSGYRWSEAVWHKDIRYGDAPGADVKMPWELARMQYLIAMAQAAALAADGAAGLAAPERYAGEFAAQIADFIAANPPRFGVNWVTSMDVGIRAANWLVAYDMFCSAGAEFPAEWEGVFRRSIGEHAAHLAANLEWSSGLRGNHYLADVVGLLFCAAWLPRSPECDVWLAFAVQEIIAETELQFLPDGGNFEASAPYHRLSGEMVVYAAALIAGLPAEKRAALREYDRRLWKFKPALRPAPESAEPPSTFWEKIHALCHFTELSGCTPPPQIGDNDSGRFLIATPLAAIMPREEAQALFLNLAYVADLPDEVMIPVPDNHTPLLAAAAALPGFEEYLPFAEEFPAEYGLAAALCKSHWFADANIPPLSRGLRLPDPLTKEQSPPAGDSAVFPDFGLAVVRSGGFTLTLRCGAIGQRGKGGHAHNDQLSLTLLGGGRQIFVDAGTYLYTPAPELRNRFRSAAMHNTLVVAGKEQNDWLPGGGDVLFWMLGDRSRGRVLEFSAGRWVGEHYGYGAPHRRTVEWRDGTLRGTDECAAAGEQFLMFHLAPDVGIAREATGAVILSAGEIRLRFSADGDVAVIDSLYSRGYGWLQRTQALRVAGGGRFGWSVEFL